MNIGEVQEIYNRLVADLAPWFGTISPTTTPILNAILQGLATTENYIFNYQAYANLQTRIKTSTGFYLDYTSKDYFGDSLPRNQGENDSSFRRRILANLLPLRGTRIAMINAVERLTGITPIIFEPWRALDCGGYSSQTAPPPIAVAKYIGYSSNQIGGAGHYGSYNYPYQAFIDVFITNGNGYGNWGGYGPGTTSFGYNVNLPTANKSRGWYASVKDQQDFITDEDIYSLINNTKVFGTIIWVRIHRGTVISSPSIILDNLGHIITDNTGNPLLD